MLFHRTLAQVSALCLMFRGIEEAFKNDIHIVHITCSGLDPKAALTVGEPSKQVLLPM